MALNLLSMLFPRPNAEIFKTSDYDLNVDERKSKYKDYDQILCEECNLQFDKQFYYCINCYSKETDIYERNRMIYGPQFEIFKMSDYDLNFEGRKEKYKDCNHVLCEKCNQEIYQNYYCINCLSKEIDRNERNRMKYG